MLTTLDFNTIIALKGKLEDKAVEGKKTWSLGSAIQTVDLLPEKVEITDKTNEEFDKLEKKFDIIIPRDGTFLFSKVVDDFLTGKPLSDNWRTFAEEIIKQCGLVAIDLDVLESATLLSDLCPKVEGVYANRVIAFARTASYKTGELTKECIFIACDPDTATVFCCSTQLNRISMNDDGDIFVESKGKRHIVVIKHNEPIPSHTDHNSSQPSANRRQNYRIDANRCHTLVHMYTHHLVALIKYGITVIDACNIFNVLLKNIHHKKHFKDALEEYTNGKGAHPDVKDNVAPISVVDHLKLHSEEAEKAKQDKEARLKYTKSIQKTFNNRRMKYGYRQAIAMMSTEELKVIGMA